MRETIPTDSRYFTQTIHPTLRCRSGPSAVCRSSRRRFNPLVESASCTFRKLTEDTKTLNLHYSCTPDVHGDCRLARSGSVNSTSVRLFPKMETHRQTANPPSRLHSSASNPVCTIRLPSVSHGMRPRRAISRRCSPLVRISLCTFQGPRTHLYPFVITCKRCRENIPAHVQTMPDTWIIAVCSLCGEKCRYLPAEIFQGRLSHQLDKKPVRSAQGGSR